MFCAVLVSIQSLDVTPYQTPTRSLAVDVVALGTMPARSMASYAVIRAIRCAGSTWGASRGDRLKKRASNAAGFCNQHPNGVALVFFLACPGLATWVRASQCKAGTTSCTSSPRMSRSQNSSLHSAWGYRPEYPMIAILDQSACPERTGAGPRLGEG